MRLDRRAAGRLYEKAGARVFPVQGPAEHLQLWVRTQPCQEVAFSPRWLALAHQSQQTGMWPVERKGEALEAEPWAQFLPPCPQ